MNKQKQRIARVGMIMIWLGLVVFFFYSFRAIIDMKSITDSRRQKTFGRIWSALSEPDLFVTEYKSRETHFILDSHCRQPGDKSQTVEIEERSISFEMNCNREIFPVFTIKGTGFLPNISGSITWFSNDPAAMRREITDFQFRTDSNGSFMFTAPVYDSVLNSGYTIVISEHLSVVSREFSEASHNVANKLWVTIQMAFLATFISFFLAIPFTFLSTRPSSWWQRSFNLILQPVLAAIRAIHPFITVIFMVALVGLGLTASVLALTLFSTAVFIVKFSEYAQEHATLSWQYLLMKSFPALAFRRFPANISIATILGVMGGGGIGFILQQELALLNYRDASVALLAIILVIGSLDLLSRAVWAKLQKDKTSITN